MAVLAGVRRAGGEGRLPVVVFDLDSTLISTAGRHLAIVREFASTAWQHDEALFRVAEALTHEDFGWTVGGPLRRRGLHDEALHSALQRFWWPRFFSSSYLDHDLPSPGAVAFVERVHEEGALVYYLTARPADTMGEGTVRSLRRLGFPVLGPRVVLHLKPSSGLRDGVFKRSSIHAIRSIRGEVVATYENEPEHAGAFREAFPNALHHLCGTICSPDAPEPHPGLIRIPDFRA